MNFYRLFTTIFIGLCYSVIFAQTEYKNVVLDRDKEDVSQFFIRNYNNYPVRVKLQYKVGSRDTEWLRYTDYVTNYDYVEIKEHEKQSFPVFQKIYALKLTYVEILKPTFGDKLGEFLDDFCTGYEAGRRNASNP